MSVDKAMVVAEINTEVFMLLMGCVLIGMACLEEAVTEDENSSVPRFYLTFLKFPGRRYDIL